MAFTLDVEPANEVYLDIFPAKVSTTSDFPTPHEEFRVIVTDNRFYVIDDTIDGPKAVVSEPYTEFVGSNKEGYTVLTAIGTFQFSRAENCGCGSRIRGLHPFAGVHHTRPR